VSNRLASEKPPVCLFAAAQPLVNSLHSEGRALLSAIKEIECLLDCGNIEQSHWDDALRIARKAIAEAKAGGAS